MLADEPTAALDSVSGRTVLELLRELARDAGRAVVLVTHDARAVAYADRIVSIEDGRLREGAHDAAALHPVPSPCPLTSGPYSLKYYQFDAPGCDRPSGSASVLCCSDGYSDESCEPGRRRR